MTFEKLELSQDLLKAVQDMGFSKATPIQAQAIPEIMAGRDVIGQASTGTGKTAAFGLPAIEIIDESNRAVQVLVLCPTRELAMQVTVEINKFLKYRKNIFALAIYGGQPIDKQLRMLRKNPQIIIGTPGRTLDHIERRTLRLDRVKMMILDEADEMLEMGFRKDIERILRSVPQERQTTLFSATMSSDILQITERYQKNPKLITVFKEKEETPAVEQAYFEVEPAAKRNVLLELIKKHNPYLSIVFCNTKRKVDRVSQNLREKGFLAEGIHGDIRQAKRDRIMSRFRKGKISILVATDVAARGIDVAGVEIVFNYEIPKDVESYIHRIGRTGRAGKTGKAMSFVSHQDKSLLRDIKWFTQATITQHQVPESCLSLASVGPFRRNDRRRDNERSYTRSDSRGFGFPRFKKRGGRDSFRIPQGVRLEPQLSKKIGVVHIPKLKKVKFIKSREIEGKIKYITISREGYKWFISFTCEVEMEIVLQEGAFCIVGIDRGVRILAQCSDGNAIVGSSPLKKHLNKLNKLLQEFAKKQKLSSNWCKLKKKIQRLYRHIANKRKDDIHKITTRLANSHGIIVMEALQTKNMTKSARGTVERPGKNVRAKSGLNRSILDSAWYMLQKTLEYKMDWRGGKVVYVDPRYTSQTCSECGHISRDNRKSQSLFVCAKCRCRTNADLNASKNILDKYLAAAGHAVVACGERTMVLSMKQELGTRKPLAV